MINKKKFIREYFGYLKSLLWFMLIAVSFIFAIFGPFVIALQYDTSWGFIIYPLALLIYIGKLAWEDSQEE